MSDTNASHGHSREEGVRDHESTANREGVGCRRPGRMLIKEPRFGVRDGKPTLDKPAKIDVVRCSRRYRKCGFIPSG